VRLILSLQVEHVIGRIKYFQLLSSGAAMRLRSPKKGKSSSAVDRDTALFLACALTNCNLLAKESPDFALPPARPEEQGALWAPGKYSLDVPEGTLVKARSHFLRGLSIPAVPQDQLHEVHVDAMCRAIVGARRITRQSKKYVCSSPANATCT